MEDLTALLPIKVLVHGGSEEVVACPHCRATTTISMEETHHHGSKELEITCRCGKTFYVQFVFKKTSIHKLQLTITNLANNDVFKNANVQHLDQHNMSFACRGQHLFRKGHKLKIQFSQQGSSPSGTPCEAVVSLVRGKYVSCYFLNPIDPALCG